jgi:hypothetical protein
MCEFSAPWLVFSKHRRRSVDELVESDTSPASNPAATVAVAGKPDHTVVAPKAEAMMPPSATPTEVSNNIVPLDVDLIDELMDLVGELNRESTELQEAVTSTKK